MRREDRAVVGLLGFLHGAVHANLLAIPVFLNLPWRSEFHADSVVVGLLAATTYACFGFSSVPFGFLADRRPPTRLLMLSAGGIAVSLASLAFSTNLPWLALSLAGLGLSSGIYHPTALAAISRSVEAQGAAMGWHGMGGSLGIALGPAFVAASLASGWPWRDAVAVLVLPPLVGLALLATRFPRVGTRPPTAVATRSRTLASGLSFFSVFGLGSIGAVLAGWLLAQGLAAAMFLALGAAIAASGVIAYGIGATVEKT